MTWLRTHTTHLFVGIGLTLLPLFYFSLTKVSWYPLNPFDHLIQHGLAYVLLVLFLSLNHTVFVPRWFLAKQYRHYALIVVSCLVSVSWLSQRIEQWVFFKPPTDNTPLAWTRQILWAENMFPHPPANPFGAGQRDRFDQETQSVGGTPPPVRVDPSVERGPQKPPPDWQRGPWTKMILIFLLGGVGTQLSISIQAANRVHQAENDQLQAELRQLKAQIQPHFLFNTLNSIYSLALRNDDRTADTIVKLAEFMRYVIRDAHRDKVPLVNETSYITNYIDLQQARLQNAVQVHYQVAGDFGRWQIAPLLLFSFIENAFKYGVNAEEESVISITLTMLEGQLRLAVSNKKVRTNALEESTGIGLQNARDRLTLLYPGAHTLLIDNTPTHFRVELSLTVAG